ncbi:MAG: hypothetical protein R3345_01995 [Fulvivirga sp.]|nr:hypothetical protein [Fulvivirga sp.]
MGKNKQLLILSGAGLLLTIAGIAFFPLLLLVALAPLLAILQIEHTFRWKYFDLIVLVVLLISLLLGGAIANKSPFLYLPYAASVWVAFVMYSFTQNHVQNHFGLLVWGIYWITIEYLLLVIEASFAYYTLGAEIANIGLTPWSGSTGILGVSAWVLFSNAMIYIVLFKANGLLEGNFRWLSLSYAVILIFLPAIIPSIFELDFKAISAQEVYNLYAGRPIENTSYQQTGEFLGRTGAWVSVLVIIYTFVKRTVK